MERDNGKESKNKAIIALMKKLDWYILRQLLSIFIMSILLIILIVIIFDLAEKLDDFILKEAPIKGLIFDYYLNFVPYFVNLFGHLFFFVSVIFLTSRMAAKTEIIAILSSGISFNRLLFPFLLASILVGGLNFYLGNFLIPEVNKPRLEFERDYYRNPVRNLNNNIHLQLSDTTKVYVQSFDNISNTAYRFSYEEYDKDGIREKINSNRIIFDSTTHKWKLAEYHRRKIDDLSEELRFGDTLVMDLGLLPQDFNINAHKVEIMNYRELNRFIERETQRGSPEVNSYLIEKYQRIFNPIAFIILTIIGVSLSSRKIRGGTGIHLAMGIGLAFSLIMMMEITSVFSTKGNLPPLLSVLLPLIIYFIIGILLIRKTPK